MCALKMVIKQIKTILSFFFARKGKLSFLWKIRFVAYIIQVLLHYLQLFSPFCTYYLLSPSLCNIVTSFCSKPSIQNDSAICIKFGACAATADCCPRFVTPAIVQRSSTGELLGTKAPSHIWQCVRGSAITRSGLR